MKSNLFKKEYTSIKRIMAISIVLILAMITLASFGYATAAFYTGMFGLLMLTIGGPVTLPR